MSAPKPFLGWPMVAVAFLLYGLGLAPSYYSWGFLAPEIIADVNLTRQEVGNTFGVFTLAFAITSPAAAIAIARFGLRPIVFMGSLIAAIGFWQTSAANTANDFLFSFAIVGGCGIGFCTLLPAQILPVNWFRRYRARATAFIVVGAAIVGGLVPAADQWLLVEHDWRFVWKVIAGIVLATGLFAATFLRAHPADVGQYRDGESGNDAPKGQTSTHEGSYSKLSIDKEWGVREAVLSRQFLLVTFACLANTVPWRVVTAHGRLHLEDLGFSASVAAAILGVRVGVSAFGRLSGSIGDFLDPRVVLAIALCASSVGMAGFAFTQTPQAAYAWIVLLGFGYGVGFTSEPVVLAHIFGARAFIGSNGLRIAITGVVGWLAPRWVGAAADHSDSYATSFVILAGLCILGAITIGTLGHRGSRRMSTQ